MAASPPVDPSEAAAATRQSGKSAACSKPPGRLGGLFFGGLLLRKITDGYQ
ncbi:MAG: hypothetical protein K0S19_1218 [Geminicoccaceae bacterium]|nr:hypothetical protein [Geminicoccaceae bacterium]